MSDMAIQQQLTEPEAPPNESGQKIYLAGQCRALTEASRGSNYKPAKSAILMASSNGARRPPLQGRSVKTPVQREQQVARLRPVRPIAPSDVVRLTLIAADRVFD